MGKLKGFYFSLDALLAASIILGIMVMMIGYNEKSRAERENVNLDQLHTSALQEVGEWNESIDSSRTILGYIYQKQYSGEASIASETCEDYFRMDENYALYFSNSTEATKICGGLEADEANNIESEHIIAPDIQVNETFTGPRRAVLVVPN